MSQISRYTSEPAYIPDTPIDTPTATPTAFATPVSLLATPLQPSPHKDHNYEVRHPGNNEQQADTADTADNRDKGKKSSANVKKGRGVGYGRSDIPATFPPLPLESDLFTPPPEKIARKEKSLGLLADR